MGVHRNRLSALNVIETMSHSPQELEEGDQLLLDYRKLQKIAATGQPVVPVVVQCVDSGEVLILAYANEQAVSESFRRQQAVFWSTSRNELWIKGASSGDTLELVEIRVNCEQNSLLYRVRRSGGGSCHTHRADGRSRSGCYYRRLSPSGKLENLQP